MINVDMNMKEVQTLNTAEGFLRILSPLIGKHVGRIIIMTKQGGRAEVETTLIESHIRNFMLQHQVEDRIRDFEYSVELCENYPIPEGFELENYSKVVSVQLRVTDVYSMESRSRLDIWVAREYGLVFRWI